MGKEKDRALYMRRYPKLNKWINECWLCHCQGYDRSIVENPNNEQTIAARNIKSYFRPLDLDEDGLCEVCSRLSKKHSSDDEEYDGDASEF
jgi:hypothetical protein